MKAFLASLDWSVLTDALLNIIPALICIVLHEISHGYAALALGDTTAKDRGRLSLNPLKHVDIFGLVMMAVFHFGWARAVPVDMRRFRNPKRGMALTALAGPVSNAVIAIVFLALWGFLYPFLIAGMVGNWILTALHTTAVISISLGLFNLIPVPPLDGFKVVFSLLPDRIYLKLMRYERYGMLLLAVLLITGVLTKPLNAAVSTVYSFLFPVAEKANLLALRLTGAF